MGIPTTDGRKVWLDESQIHAHKFLSKMLECRRTTPTIICREEFKTDVSLLFISLRKSRRCRSFR